MLEGFLCRFLYEIYKGLGYSITEDFRVPFIFRGCFKGLLQRSPSKEPLKGVATLRGTDIVGAGVAVNLIPWGLGFGFRVWAS